MLDTIVIWGYISRQVVFAIFSQDDIFKKSMKASLKFTKLITTGEPSINTSLHLVKPIVLYGSEIWGTFKANSAACKKSSCFAFEEIYRNNIADKSQIKYLKYILGVNKHFSNLAVLSETGRFQMIFFSLLFQLRNICID